MYYQARIIEHGLDLGIGFVIRAKMSRYLRKLIVSRPEQNWPPLIDHNDKPRNNKQACKITHAIGDLTTPFYGRRAV